MYLLRAQSRFYFSLGKTFHQLSINVLVREISVLLKMLNVKEKTMCLSVPYDYVVVNCIFKNTSLLMFDWVLNTPLVH